MTQEISPWGNIETQIRVHEWHSMCSYLGSFPPAIPRSMIQMLTQPGDLVFDPFSGRGTTLLEARQLGRPVIASDLNPQAVSLSKAKATNVPEDAILARIDDLQLRYKWITYYAEADLQPDDIKLIFHPKTLAQLVYLKRRLLKSDCQADLFLTGALLGVLHGSEKRDGSSSYASISMPNTFSMSPNYVRRFVSNNRLRREERNVFDLLRWKVKRLYRSGLPKHADAVVDTADCKTISRHQNFAKYIGAVDLVVTSPPYLGVLNYAKQNWIRDWLLGIDWNKNDNYGIDDNLQIGAWCDFAERFLSELKMMLSPSGTIVLVVGDVTKANTSSVSLARIVIRALYHSSMFKYIGYMDDSIDPKSKTTRIWSDTKGQATAIDRLIFLSSEPPHFNLTAIEHVAPSRKNSFQNVFGNVEKLQLDALRFAGL